MGRNKLVCDDTTILIDPWSNPAAFGGDWKDPIAPIQVDTKTCAVLITHIHTDHFDVDAVKALFDKTPGSVICHSKVAAYVASRGFRPRSLETYEPLIFRDFTVAPVPAQDAYDDDQVSWVVTVAGKRLIHCGDTMWHGAFWKLRHQYGPFDAAFLPINGFKSKGATFPDSDVPGDLTPEQAVAAGVVLGAKLAVPIHYGITNSTQYFEYPNPEATFLQIARRRNLAVEVVKPGDWMKWKSTSE